MKLRAVSGIMLTLFILSMLTLAFNIQPVRATGSIYIRADGSVYASNPYPYPPPSTPNITSTDNVTYTFTDNIYCYIGVERDNIVIDGAGYTLQGTGGGGDGYGIGLSIRSNVTITNMEIKRFARGIDLWYSSNNIIAGNNITANNEAGIHLGGSSNNIIYGNNITNNHLGIYLWSSSNNNIYGNNITNNYYGISLSSSSNNNTIYHNNFINNYDEQASAIGVVNTWNNSYPSGGNHWSDYTGDDFFSGPYQNETGFDGIGDTPYNLSLWKNINIQDNYPLIVPWPLKYKIYSLTVDPVFYDSTGTTLIQPSSWTIKFPSGTTRTVSSPVTYNLTQTGNYSIVSIIWKGVEVIPETTPTTSLTSDIVWSPSINCLLPTSLPISLSSSTSYVGFKVEINGNLTCNDVGLAGVPILLSYSVTGGESWNDITLVNTTSDGGYSAEWMLPATGNYLVIARWSGNVTYPGATTIINLAVIPFKEQTVFSVTSNSTVSELAFNSTSRELSFTVTGPAGTTGYVNVYIAKTLIDNIADVKVYLDGDQLNYTTTSEDDSWLLHFTYSHSTHTIAMSLGLAPFIPPQLISPLSLGILALALAVATILLISKIRRGTPPTILDGVFRESKQAQIATTTGTKKHKTRSMQGI